MTNGVAFDKISPMAAADGEKSEFGRRLASLIREHRRMSIRGFAAASGISPNTLALAFKRRSLDELHPSTVQQIATGAKLSISELNDWLNVSPPSLADLARDFVAACGGIDNAQAELDRLRKAETIAALRETTLRIAPTLKGAAMTDAETARLENEKRNKRKGK